MGNGKVFSTTPEEFEAELLGKEARKIVDGVPTSQEIANQTSAPPATGAVTPKEATDAKLRDIVANMISAQPGISKIMDIEVYRVAIDHCAIAKALVVVEGMVRSTLWAFWVHGETAVLSKLLDEFFLGKMESAAMKELGEETVYVEVSRSVGLDQFVGSDIAVGFQLDRWTLNATTGETMEYDPVSL